MSIQQEVRNSWHDSIVELFELDLSPITEQSIDKFYFTKDIFPDGTKPQWKGQIYEPFPIEITGFETTTNGPIPTPELTVANVLGTLSSAANALGDLVGARVTRRRTLGKYLDNGVNPNSTEEFPEDIYFIERKISESSLSITWQLASKIDLEGLQIPRRIITQNYCIWEYRSAECGYTGPPIADDRDRPLASDGSTAVNDYLQALRQFERAISRERRAQVSLNLVRNEITNACNPNLFPVAETFSRINRAPYSFGLQVSGQPLAAFVEGAAVSFATHRLGRTVSTGFGATADQIDSATGPVYALRKITKQVDEEGEPLDDIIEDFFSVTAPPTYAFSPRSNDGFIAILGGQLIDLVPPGEEGFSLGPQLGRDVARVTAVGSIDFVNNVCNSAQVKFAEAELLLAQRTSERESAGAALDTAIANLPANAELFRNDVCGKRLASCKLRFGNNDLPFGGFPGANLVR
jgi:lambda family phage minor tail protein L